MAQFETAQLTKFYREHCEDRVNVIHEGVRTIIVVADGAAALGMVAWQRRL